MNGPQIPQLAPPGPVPPQGGPGPQNPLAPESWTDPVMGANNLLQALAASGVPPPLVLQGFSMLAQSQAQPGPPPGAPGGAPGPMAPPAPVGMNELFG